MLDWTSYDEFDWKHTQQHPMGISDRTEVERLVAEVLESSQVQREQAWGRCSPPGRFAATVVHLSHFAEDHHAAAARKLGIDEIGIKVFKTSVDGQREGKKVVQLCRDAIHRRPGLPNDHVQKTIDAGMSCSGDAPRHYVVQQWMAGDTLEDLIRRRWILEPIGGTVARSVLEQLFGGIVIPLWSAGTIWWDFRDANYCWDESNTRLAMIDVDSLAAYADEILYRPSDWSRRNKGRETALSRLRQMTLRILLAQGLTRKAAVARELDDAWNELLRPVLQTLGCDAYLGTAALEVFLDRLKHAGLFR
jgi:hypothetical protein